MNTPFKTPNTNEYESQMRAAFMRGLLAQPKRSKLTGRVFHALCSKAGIKRV